MLRRRNGRMVDAGGVLGRDLERREHKTGLRWWLGHVLGEVGLVLLWCLHAGRVWAQGLLVLEAVVGWGELGRAVDRAGGVGLNGLRVEVGTVGRA